jgi:hypothetical protein
MHTVAEILAAVRLLSVDDKRELLKQLTLLLTTPDVPPNVAKVDDHLHTDFTARLVAHFHRAKRAALLRTS